MIRNGKKRFGPLLPGVLKASLLLILALSCSDDAISPPGLLDVTPFIEQAQSSECAQTRNNLYLIDTELVFWDTEGLCEDAAYSQALYGGSTDNILCLHAQTIAGEITVYNDESYKALFDTMIANLDEPDLGIGEEHSVKVITF